MSNGILIGENPLVQPPYDKFWDSAPTRREIQIGFNKIGHILSELHAADDTASILINFICEKKLIDPNDPESLKKLRAEVEEFVAEKKTQLEALAANAIGQVGSNE